MRVKVELSNDHYTDECWYELWDKLLKYSFPITFIVSLLFVFTPTTKEAFTIWGVGGTIDYIQSNETIQQLPDKVVNALNVWVVNGKFHFMDIIIKIYIIHLFVQMVIHTINVFHITMILNIF